MIEVFIELAVVVYAIFEMTFDVMTCAGTC
jgi:hypothetical protein